MIGLKFALDQFNHGLDDSEVTEVFPAADAKRREEIKPGNAPRRLRLKLLRMHQQIGYPAKQTTRRTTIEHPMIEAQGQVRFGHGHTL